MTTAAPPLVRRTTSTPRLRHSAKSTSPSSDDERPMTTAGRRASHTRRNSGGCETSAAGSVSGLGSFQPHIERFEKNGQTFYRARFVGFGGRADATAMCSELKKAKMSCLAMQS